MSRATDAYDVLTVAMLDVDPACQNDGRFILDDQPAHTLAYVCNDCPLIELCRTFAELAKPKAGIWAGKRYRTNKTTNEEKN